MNTPLSTAHIEDPDFETAAAELLQNAQRLIAAGCFTQAHAALDLLVQPGPWNASGHTQIMNRLQNLLPLACHLSGKPSPKVRHAPAMPVAELAQWAQDQARQKLGGLAQQTRFEAGTVAGQNWSAAYLQSLPGIADKSAREKAFQAFLDDAGFVLQKRLEQAGIKPLYGAKDMRTPFFLGLIMRGVMTYARSAPKIAGAAKATSTASIVSATADYVRHTGARSNKGIEFIYLAATVLGMREGRLDDAALAANALAENDWGRSTLIDAAVWPPIAELLRSGRCAAAAGTDRTSGNLYLLALKRRPEGLARPAPGAPESPESDLPGAPESGLPGAMESMIFAGPLLEQPAKQATAHPPTAKPPHAPCSLDALREALATTPLAGREIVELPILDTDERAYAIEIDPRELEAMWRIARGRVTATQRWPVVTTLWSGGGPSDSFRDKLLEEDLFSRFYFMEAPDAGDVSPRAILAAADSADVAQFLRNRMQENAEHQPLSECLEYELDATRSECGSAPAKEEVTRARIDGKPISSVYQLDRWLMEWERTHGQPLDLDQVRQDWYEPGNAVLLFLPTPNPWDTLAYLSFYGSAADGVENYIALGRQWQKRCRAELVAHFGTMLQCYATHPPASAEDAWQLAVEHDIFAADTLRGPGITLRHHAMGLVGHDRWFLHQRP